MYLAIVRSAPFQLTTPALTFFPMTVVLDFAPLGPDGFFYVGHGRDGDIFSHCILAISVYCRRLRGGNFPESPSLRSGAVGDNGISGADGSRDGATNADGVISRDPGGNGAGADDANR